jgi:hypothetical protein
VPVGGAGNDDLGPHPVGRRRQHRLAVAAGIEAEEAGEATQVAHHLRSGGALHRGLHQLDGSLTSSNIDAGGGIRGRF